MCPRTDHRFQIGVECTATHGVDYEVSVTSVGDALGRSAPSSFSQLIADQS
jgi:hypothetical protein